MNNRDIKDNEPRERIEHAKHHSKEHAREHERRDTMDTSWILPALLGLLLLGTLGWFLFRRGTVTTPEAVTTVTETRTAEPVKAEEAVQTAVTEAEKTAASTTTNEKPKI